ncbi:hypothetical protein [Nocardia terpenica]|uniref:hypothetical protein n=1 Tax=Nocardia terpenica TaxID=455432 RepID=UPI00142D371F|nr:hypothetical protein [Nocardia terpenica]
MLFSPNPGELISLTPTELISLTPTELVPHIPGKLVPLVPGMLLAGISLDSGQKCAGTVGMGRIWCHGLTVTAGR